MATKKGRGLFMVYVDVPAPLEDELNRWYNEEHIPERLAIPGVLNAARYVAVRGDRNTWPAMSWRSRRRMFLRSGNSVWPIRLPGRSACPLTRLARALYAMCTVYSPLRPFRQRSPRRRWHRPCWWDVWRSPQPSMPLLTLPIIPNACRYTAASQGIDGRGGLSRYGVNRRMNRNTCPCTSVNVRRWRTVQHGKRCVKRTPRCGRSAYSRTSRIVKIFEVAFMA